MDENTEYKHINKIFELKDNKLARTSFITDENKEEILNEIEKWVNQFVKDYKDNKFSIEEFEIKARNVIISDQMRYVLLQREEELLATINHAQGEIEEFETEKNKIKEKYNAKEDLADSAKATAIEREIQSRFTNAELADISRLRSQLIPGIFMELETLITAIDTNSNIYKRGCDYMAEFARHFKWKKIKDDAILKKPQLKETLSDDDEDFDEDIDEEDNKEETKDEGLNDERVEL